MTLMLASVIDASEAEIALRGGADVVDFEDSRSGVLAPSSWEAIEAGVKAAAGRGRVSAALGQPPYEPENLAKRVRALVATGVGAVKLAIDGQSLDRLERPLRALAREVDLVGVLWADRDAGLDCLPRLATIGFKGAMLDTADKGGKRLLDHRSPPELEAFCARCRDLGLDAALAGSLEPPDVPRLMLVAPSLLAFRRALCAGHRRDGPLDARSIARIRGLIPRETEPDSPSIDGCPSERPLDRVSRAQQGVPRNARLTTGY